MVTSRIRWQFFQYIKLCEDEGIRSDIGAARGAGLLTGVGKNLLAAGRLAGKTPLPAAAEAPSPASATAPGADWVLSLIHISEPTRLRRISYAVFCLKKKKQKKQTITTSKAHIKKPQKQNNTIKN